MNAALVNCAISEAQYRVVTTCRSQAVLYQYNLLACSGERTVTVASAGIMPGQVESIKYLLCAYGRGLERTVLRQGFFMRIKVLEVICMIFVALKVRRGELISDGICTGKTIGIIVRKST